MPHLLSNAALLSLLMVKDNGKNNCIRNREGFEIKILDTKIFWSSAYGNLWEQEQGKRHENCL